MVPRWRKGREMPRPKKTAELDKSEKITINVGLVDLGQIDLLVSEGFFANRTDFIRTAIRRQLEARSSAVDGTVARRQLTPRQRAPTAATTSKGCETLVAWSSCASSGWPPSPTTSPPELALATIAAVEVLGAFRAPRAVKAALAPRTT